MKRVMEVVRDGKHIGWMIFCPACHCGHQFDDKWTFNGNVELPTFIGSMLVGGYLGTDNDGKDMYGTCHSYVNEGRIEFLNDCTHTLRGKTMDLPDMETLGNGQDRPHA